MSWQYVIFGVLIVVNSIFAVMGYQDYISALKVKATEVRMATLKSIASGGGFTGSALSAVEILVALYYGHNVHGPILKIDPAKPGWEGQDYFVLSKANAAPAWYAILADLGFLDQNELKYYRQAGALLSAHPKPRIPGVPLGSGGPGQGLAAAVGLAMSLKMERARNKVFCLIGDAEMAHGNCWEALIQASHLKLGNLVVVVDRNSVQVDGLVRNLNLIDPIAEKFDMLGFRTCNVLSGNDLDQLLGAYDKALVETRIPVAIICKTVKAKGVDFAENKSYYHDKPLSEQELAEALKSLQRRIESLAKTIHD